jgi:hypothetical protein
MASITSEAVADLLVAQLRSGDTDPGALLVELRAATHPYLAWALAWVELSAAAESDPDDHAARRALHALRAVEPAVSALDARRLGSTKVP